MGKDRNIDNDIDILLKIKDQVQALERIKLNHPEYIFLSQDKYDSLSDSKLTDDILYYIVEEEIGQYLKFYNKLGEKEEMVKDIINYNNKEYQLTTTFIDDCIFETIIYPVENGIVSDEEVYKFATFESSDSQSKHKDIIENPGKFLSDEAVNRYLKFKGVKIKNQLNDIIDKFDSMHEDMKIHNWCDDSEIYSGITYSDFKVIHKLLYEKIDREYDERWND